MLFLVSLSSFLQPASAQTLTITNGIQTYAALTNTTVIMAGRCELRLTATNSPLPGCIINLNSADSWFLLPNLQPSVVVASYLSQVRVNGAVAVADGNCRVVQYGSGSVVVPHAPSFQPLQVFSEPHFTSTAASLSRSVYYKGTGLGALNATISSFKLKRGYMATFAQNEDGTGLSRCYVAQDGDLEVSVLPAALDNRVRFVYVLPWRWTSKKGIAGNIANGLNVQWFYNWNLDQNSSRDLEYVPIRQTRYWPGLGQNWQTRGANHLLGYNEPDNPLQDAYMTVSDAISSWPDLLGTGLRVGSPAVTDGGRSSWLYPFLQQADTAGLRVDFVAVHYYWCYNPADPNGAATQMYNFLKATYDQVKRPLWVTEWNNGANWTGCGDPTEAQQQAVIAAMIAMLDNTPFVERYALYNWVEDARRVQWDDGSLTSAGVTYRDQISPLSHVQEIPDPGSRSIAQLRFESNTLDTSGHGNNSFAFGSPAFSSGQQGQAIEFDGINNFIQLPPNIANSNTFSFAAWIYWNGGDTWQRVFDFGGDTTHYLFLTPNSGSGTLRFAIKNGGTEQTVQTSALPVGSWQHVAVTLNGNTARIYVNGALAASSTSFSILPSAFTPSKNYLGRSQFTADPLFSGKLDEVQIADYAFTAAQVASLMTNIPPQFTNSLFARGSATEGQSYSNSIAGTAADSDAGDTLTYSKAVGPAWLNVAADGTLTGSPTFADSGTNYFTVRVTDAAGASAFALVTISTTISTANGTWISDASAAWSVTNRWSGGIVAIGPGQTADFSTINITGNRTVTLDSSRSIGTLMFGDTSGSQTWTLTNSGGSVLTLDTGAGTSPSLVVNQNTATISAPLAGLNGITKSGAGTLMLFGVNTYSGATTISAGTLAVGGSGQLGSGTYAGNITDNATLNCNSSATQTLSGVIPGTGTFTQASGTVTLSGNNTFTGGTTVNGGTMNLAKGGSTGTIRNNLTINAGATVNLTASDALGYTNSGSGITFVTKVNLAGGTLNNGVNGNNGFNTKFNLTGGTMSSTGGGAYNFDGATGAGINSLASGTASTVSGRITLRSAGIVFSTAPGSVPSGIDLSISGAIGEQYGSFGFAKSGAGTLALSGANTYSGDTAISGGTLLVNGAITVSPVTIASTATLGGDGVIGSPVTVQSGGTLAPGTSIGKLTVNNTVTLQAGSTTRMEINKAGRTNDQLRVVGTLTYGGMLVVTNLGGTLWAGDSFQIFNASSTSDAFTATNLPSLPAGFVWQWAPTSGTLSIVSTVALNPTNVIANLAGDTLQLSWRADHTGWRMETNSVDIAHTNSWFTLAGASATNQMFLPVNPSNRNVFFRLVFP